MNQPLRILLVEDNDDDEIILLRELRTLGFDPSHVRVQTADEMRTALDHQAFDAILCDYSLPSFSAPEAIRLVQALGVDVPFIVISGTIGEEVAVDAVKAGAHDYLLKGRLTRLRVAIERELREAENRRQRRRTEAALQISEERYRRLADNAPDVIYRLGMVGSPVVEYLSPAVERLTGHRVAPLVGAGIDVLPILDEDRAAFATSLTQAEPGGSPTLIRWREAAGRVRFLEHRHAAVRDEEGRLLAVEGIARDVTEQRQLEEQYRVAHRMEGIGRLAGGIAHDFNNLLTVIANCTAALLEREGFDDAARADLSLVADSARRAADLTRQLLAFSRRQIRTMAVLDLTGLVSDFTRLAHRLLGEDVIVDLHLPIEPVHVESDPSQLEQVLMNLVVNARDAMPEGGRLTLEVSPLRLDAEYSRQHLETPAGEYVMLAVSDTGQGMDEATMDRIFEPFFTTKPMGKGSGLGLATVYGIVKQNGGSIFVYSEPGRGSTFKIYLPRVSPGAPAAADPTPPSRPAAGGDETLLLVEDDPAVRRIALRILAGGGYRVLDAGSGTEAIRIASEHPDPIHVLLTDVVMPGMSGRAVAEACQAIRPELRVVFMSGYTENAIVHQGVVDPGVCFVQKPFSVDSLLAAVRQASGR